MEWRSLRAPAASQPYRSCVGKRNEWKSQREGLRNESRPGGGKRWRRLRSWQSGGKWTWGGAASRAALRARERFFAAASDLTGNFICVLEETEYLKHFGIAWLSPHCVSQWYSYFKELERKSQEETLMLLGVVAHLSKCLPTPPFSFSVLPIFASPCQWSRRLLLWTTWNSFDCFSQCTQTWWQSIDLYKKCFEMLSTD